MTKRAYIIPEGIDPTNLPWVFEGAGRELTVNGGVVIVDGSVAGYPETQLPSRPAESWTPVTPRQIRQALTRAGLRASVETAVASMDADTRDWWEFATSFERHHPAVDAVGGLLGTTEGQLDELFLMAAQL